MVYFQLSFIFVVLVCSFNEKFVESKGRRKGSLAIPDDVANSWYNKYREAFADDVHSNRRLNRRDNEYRVHIEKLKEVNGVKKHNLRLEVKRGKAEKIVYFNNPVESKFPHPYLSLSEFKNILTKQALKRKSNLRKKNSNTHTLRYTVRNKPTRTRPSELVGLKRIGENTGIAKPISAIKSKSKKRKLRSKKRKLKTIKDLIKAATNAERVGGVMLPKIKVKTKKTTKTNFKAFKKVLQLKESEKKNNEVQPTKKSKLTRSGRVTKTLKLDYLEKKTDEVARNRNQTESKSVISRDGTKQNRSSNHLNIQSTNNKDIIQSVDNVSETVLNVSHVESSNIASTNALTDIDIHATKSMYLDTSKAQMQNKNLEATISEDSQPKEVIGIVHITKTEEFTTAETTRKRRTLGRPAVFMGS